MISINEFAQLADVNITTFRRWVRVAGIAASGDGLYDDEALTKVLFAHTACKATIYKKDTYRRTGRGRFGFEMHYRKQQCSRYSVDGEYCWQHREMNQASL